MRLRETGSHQQVCFWTNLGAGVELYVLTLPGRVAGLLQYECPHGPLNNKTPRDIWVGKLKGTPFSDEVYNACDPSKKDYRAPGLPPINY